VPAVVASRRLFVLALGASLALAVLACGFEDTPDEPTAAPGLESFRYRLTVSLEESDRPYRVVQQGEVVLPDREHATLDIAIGPWRHQGERLAIGDREWLRGDLPWFDLAASPLSYLGAEGGGFSLDALDGLPAIEETVDGVATRRYELDAAALQALVGGDASLVVSREGALSARVWVDPGRGAPVAVELRGASDEGHALRLRLEVYDVNDPGISIEEP